MKSFLIDITHQVNMGPQGTHIALVFFATQAQVVFDFTEFNKYNIRRMIDEAPHQRGFTFINEGLKAAEEQVFRTEFGMRPHVKKVFWDKKKTLDWGTRYACLHVYFNLFFCKGLFEQLAP